ncbi:MAG: GH36-type glycosyl hydrolase domain-containing protein [Gaiellaceae bacterium]
MSALEAGTASAIGANPYGHFDAEAREYVITRPDTPTPWINYLGEGRYGGIVSNTGGGYSFDRDPRNRRVSRYRYNAIPDDQPGRYVYLRDEESGEYWSATWQPVKRSLDGYECRHGAGYTRISASLGGIASEILYFVPPSAGGESWPCELWVLRVRNDGDRPRRLRSFSYVELSMYDAVIDQQNLDWGQHIFASRLEDGAIVAGTLFRPERTFFGSSAAPLGFDSDRERFVGRCRDLANPIVVESGEPTNQGSPRGNSIGSLCHELELAPGEERQIVFVLGVSEDPAQIERALATFRDPAAVERAFQALREDWDAFLSRFVVDTPDPDLNAMVNFWNQVQCRTTLYWSRFVSAYESGVGRGMGTRDSAQDTLGTMHTVPDHARATLTRIWQLQFADGHTWHQFFPLTGEGSAGLAEEFPEWPQWFSDDHLWLVIAVCAYLRETADFDYLEQLVPYEDAPAETIWQHMMRAVDFTLQHRGPHGLPRAGFSDWDDTMNIDHGSGKAESVWCGMQFCRAVLDLAELAETLARAEDAERFRAHAREMSHAINENAWDGEWYARAYDDGGRPIGVASEALHRINMNPQTWCVIGEVAPRERAERALESLDEKLATEFGIALLWPPYNGGDDRVRGTSTYPPGAKENGGIFCHANTWAIVAAAMLGWSDRAYDYYRRVLPLLRTDSDRFLVEPYVYCQNICGPTHPQFGMGRNAWLTGTAAWTYVAGTQWILGIRPTYAGLRIAPALPGAWGGFQARRVFRDVLYDIRVERKGEGNEVSLTVDGEPLAGDVVPHRPGRERVLVEVAVGA